jgi:HAE1 family hydrophobic/amphiphilic exporter-1
LLDFGIGVLEVCRELPSGFVANEEQGMIYAILQTPLDSLKNFAFAE